MGPENPMPPAPLRKAFIHPVKMDSGRDFQPKTYTDQDHLAGAEAQRNFLQATKVLEELKNINQELSSPSATSTSNSS